MTIIFENPHELQEFVALDTEEEPTVCQSCGKTNDDLDSAWDWLLRMPWPFPTRFFVCEDCFDLMNKIPLVSWEHFIKIEIQKLRDGT